MYTCGCGQKFELYENYSSHKKYCSGRSYDSSIGSTPKEKWPIPPSKQTISPAGPIIPSNLLRG